MNTVEIKIMDSFVILMTNILSGPVMIILTSYGTFTRVIVYPPYFINIVEVNLSRGHVGSTHASFLFRGHSVRLRQRPSGDMGMMRRCGCSQDKTVRDTQLRWWRLLEVRNVTHSVCQNNKTTAKSNLFTWQCWSYQCCSLWIRFVIQEDAKIHSLCFWV